MSIRSNCDRLHFYQTVEQPCAYLPDQRATNTLADPGWPMDASAFGVLLANGFRRSGDNVYRPQCANCQACVPVRVRADTFTPSRNQRRTARANTEISHQLVEPSVNSEYLALYQRYVDSRHPTSEMKNNAEETFRHFLISSWSRTLFIEYRLAGRLIAVAVTDQVPNALSAVYTFFDPSLASRSLGRLTILRQLEVVSSLELSWLYLGYSIAACQNMAYKSGYLPQQHFIAGAWRDVTTR